MLTKVLLFGCLCLTANFYNVRGQRMDLSSALNNQQLVRSQFDCVLDRGPCDSLGNLIKNLIAPAVLRDNCRMCNPQQVMMSQMIIRYLEQNYPEDWQLLQNKYRNSGGK